MPYGPIENLYRLGYSKPQRVRPIGLDADGSEVDLPTTAPGARERALRELGQLNTFEDADAARVSADRDAYSSAVREGFRGVDPSAEAARYGRGIEQFKLEAPIEQQRIQSQGIIGQARESARGALDVERERQSGLTNQANQLNELYRMMMGSGGQADVSSLRLPTRSGGGGMTFRQQQRVPSALLRDVTAARNALEGAKGRDWFGPSSATEQADQQYRAALGAVFGQDPSDADIQEVALEIATDPDLRDLPVNELFAHPKFLEKNDPSFFEEADVQNLQRLLNYARGVAEGQF